MYHRSKTWIIVAAVAAAMLAAACGDDSSSTGTGTPGDGLAGVRHDFNADDGKLRVATTVAPITSIVLNVGGNRIHIHALIPDGVDSHTFEPKPSDAAVLSRADMLIMNGANLEGSTADLARKNLRDSTKIYRLADTTLRDDAADGFLYDFSFPRAEGNPNPHLWMNPKYAARFAALTRDWLGENDPANREYYAANYERFAAVLTQLDEAIRKDSASVPPGNRKLLTYHDSWAYWAREYGWTVVGALQPSDFKEPSAREVAALIGQIKEQGVPAVFGSEVFPSETLETIAKESGAAFEDKLRDDAPPGAVDAREHTYVGMIVQDMKILFERLGGSATEVAKVPVENTFGR